LLGTALGSLTETQAFVENMIRENEAAPMPRAFSASVHNASASRVAIALKARGENQTFVGGELSFVQALFAAARRSATGETGPVLVGALDEVTDYVRVGREHCPSSLDAGEGGAILYCDAPDAPALAMLRLVAFGPSPDAAAWIARHAEGVEADCALVPTAALGEGLKNAVVAPPLTGDHPAAAASAVALAVAVIVGELPPATLGCDAVPSRILVVAASRFGEFGLLLLEAPQ
jgi:hypothetical protein